MRRPTAIRWRGGEIRRLAGDAWLCRQPVRSRLTAQKVEIVIGGRGTGRWAWGQFLDPEHHSTTHWGRFGTSAAVQALALDLHWGIDDGNQTKVRSKHPSKLVPNKVLPADDLPNIKKLEDELKRQDFDDPMKVAFMADAAVPDLCDEAVQDSPPIVERLLELAIDTDGWSTRPDADGDRYEKDRLLVTAYALFVLRRFPSVQTDARIVDAWDWLAQQVLDRATTLGEDLLALSCLALVRAHPRVRNEQIDAAIAAALRELYSWSEGTKHPAIARPYFNSYACGTDTDYIFLSPELLCALLFLNVKEPPRQAKSFTLDVVRAVVDNIVPPDLPQGFQGAAHGFTIQRGMEGTVDQMWALRLLRTFYRQHEANPRSLRPSRVSWPGIAGTTFFASGFAALAAGLGLFGEGGSKAVLWVAAAFFSAAAGTVLLDLRERRR